ncbi:hypothetical protein [Paenibacillus sp. KS-LC4]|uniref:hypothetical protein n=1 Tax=Paenibacillus sp. KS-LC4 TaxID=2979727 RepID=UPI0030CAC0DF
MNNSAVTELDNLLQKNIDSLKEKGLKNDQKAIIQLVRTMDYYLLGSMFGNERSKKILKHYCYGWGIAFNVFIDKAIDNDNVPSFKSNDRLIWWADALLDYCNVLGVLKQCIDHSKTGLATVEKLADEEFQVRYSNNTIMGVEAIEREEFFWHNEFITRTQATQANSLGSSAKDIHESMKKLVFISRGYFLGYDTTPEIDTFYFKLSKLEIQKKMGYDSFPPNTLFGEYTYEFYLEALCILSSFSLKHLGFASNQLAKGGECNSVNLVQLFTLKSDTAESLSKAMQIDVETANKFIDIFTLQDVNKTYACSKVNGPIPPLIKISSNHILYFHSGFMAQPVLFMLGELRRHYQKDWDRALDKREEIFRNDLYSLFPLDRFLKINRPIVIKLDRKVLTDIDGFIYDQDTGTLALFQLKWQEPFANSMFERNSRKKNFEQESTHWIEAISNWLLDKSSEELASSFGLKSNAFKDYKRSRLFVIGRNFSQFSGNELPDERAAWGMWPQLMRLLLENSYTENDTLNCLFNLLIKDSPIGKAKKRNEDFENQIIDMDGYRIKMIT